MLSGRLWGSPGLGGSHGLPKSLQALPLLQPRRTSRGGPQFVSRCDARWCGPACCAGVMQGGVWSPCCPRLGTWRLLKAWNARGPSIACRRGEGSCGRHCERRRVVEVPLFAAQLLFPWRALSFPARRRALCRCRGSTPWACAATFVGLARGGWVGLMN